MTQPAPPDRIGPYRVVRELGRGGMGVVYEARRDGSDRPLVLKAILGAAASPDALLRFQREAELMARVRHPNLVAVHELLATPRGPVIVCDLVEGEPLSRRARSGWRDDRAAAGLVLRLADAVHALHRASILHRDLKPENVIVRPDGTPVLLDLGIARDQTAARLTVTGALLGSPSYMSPEQANGELPQAVGTALGPATDVYGLGAILFELLAGRPPHHDETSLQTCLFKVASGAPPLWPRATRPDVPKALEAIVRVAMAPAPASRYPSAAALREDLERFLAGSASEAEALIFPRPSRAPWVALGGAVALGVGLAGAVVAVALDGAAPTTPASTRPATAAVASRAPVAAKDPAWLELARALSPGLRLPARGPVLLKELPVRANIHHGPQVWALDPERIVTVGVDPDGGPQPLLRSLRTLVQQVPARQRGLRLVPGALLGLEREWATVSQLDPVTLAPGPAAPLPVPLLLDRPIVTRRDAAGVTIVGVTGEKGAPPTEVVALRLGADGQLVRLPGRLEPPAEAAGVSGILLAGARLVVGFVREGSLDKAESERVSRGEVVSLRIEPTGFSAPRRLLLEYAPTALALSDDGRRLCVGTSIGQVYVSDPDPLAPLEEGLLASDLSWDELHFRVRGAPAPHAHTGAVHGAVFARDGTLYTSSIEFDFTVASELRRWALGGSRSERVERATRPGADRPPQLHGLARAVEGRLLLAATGLGSERERALGPSAVGGCTIEVWLVDDSP